MQRGVLVEHELDLAGQRVPVEAAARWLTRPHAEGGNNPRTVEFYDFGGSNDLTPAPSPPDRVTLEDIGRLVCFAATLNYTNAQELLAFDTDAWPTVDIPPLTGIEGDDDTFLTSEPVQQLWRLWQEVTALRGVQFAVASKLLHLKWPQFVPITDNAFQALYRSMAVQRHNACELIRTEAGDRRPRRNSANVRAYWLAFRDDVRANQAALRHLRDAIDEVASRHPEPDYPRRLQHLTDVRLLDAVAWGLSTGRLGESGG
jgi:hypothetical protein